MMNDRPARIGRDPEKAEMEGPVHERAGRTHGQGPRIDTQEVSIRVASPGDTESLRGMFSRVSSETIYRRFHISYRDVPERTLALMLDVDRHDKESFVAVAEEEVVGHAMYARLGDGGEAEMAIVVEDGCQSKGVGKLLLRELAEKARSRGVETFVGTVLMENRRMLGLIRAVFTGARFVIADGVFHFRVPLRTLEPADPVRILRRAA
jgi:GNAT superfamily N-acetyltransferase